MKLRKGFTIVEMVVTIAILSVAFGLSAVAFSNLSRIQSSATTQLAISREIDKINKVVNEYISIVSLRTSSIKFDYEHVESGVDYVTFKEDDANPSYSYTLRSANSTIAYFSNYSGDNEYLKKHRVESFKNINEVTMNYNQSLALLVLDIKYSGTKNIRYSYIVRTAL